MTKSPDRQRGSMQTVEKALYLLDFFDDKHPELGLSGLARLAGMDKATTHRMLTALARAGMVEQQPATRLYRLGATILRLARIREATFPVTALLQPILEALAAETGETAHASLQAGPSLANVGVVESPRSSRVFVEPGLKLPLHATASGNAFLAFSDPAFVEHVLAQPLASITPDTITDPAALRERLAIARRDGFAHVDQGFEAEVYGIAAPLFGPDGNPVGAIAVATPTHRMTGELSGKIARAVMAAAVTASRAMGGEPPQDYQMRLERNAA